MSVEYPNDDELEEDFNEDYRYQIPQHHSNQIPQQHLHQIPQQHFNRLPQHVLTQYSLTRRSLPYHHMQYSLPLYPVSPYQHKSKSNTFDNSFVDQYLHDVQAIRNVKQTYAPYKWMQSPNFLKLLKDEAKQRLDNDTEKKFDEYKSSLYDSVSSGSY